MKIINQFLISIIYVLITVNIASAGQHPEAYFGKYGLEYFPTVDGYQKYVGEIVQYIPEIDPSYDDYQFIVDYKGKFNTRYIIERIYGNSEKIKMVLIEKDNPRAKKVKFEFINHDTPLSYDGEIFCHTENYQVPLLLIEKYENDTPTTNENVLTEKNGVLFKIKGMKIGNPEYGRPSLCYEIYNPLIDQTCEVSIKFIDTFRDSVGNVYSDPKCKFSYTLIDQRYERTSREDIYVYTLLNSMTNKSEKTVYSVNTNSETVSGMNADDYCKNKFREAIEGFYTLALTKVEKPIDPSIRYGETVVVKDSNLTKYSYVDNIIDLLIYANDRDFLISLKNISSNTIKIVWDEAVYVGVDNSSSKIIHTGTKYANRYESQPATVVIKNSKIEERITPSDLIYYDDVLYNKWTSEYLIRSGEKMLGKQMKLMLPIQIKDVMNEYLFVFDVIYEYKHPELIVNTL